MIIVPNCGIDMCLLIDICSFIDTYKNYVESRVIISLTIKRLPLHRSDPGRSLLTYELWYTQFTYIILHVRCVLVI
jgi:hypothetical protein